VILFTLGDEDFVDFLIGQKRLPIARVERNEKQRHSATLTHQGAVVDWALGAL
jgi:hypothetical protein